MSHVVRLNPLALREYRDARTWYARIRPSLGEGFRNAVVACLNRIAADPASLPIHRRSYRSIRTKKFPYVLFFVVNENTVVVQPSRTRRVARTTGCADRSI